MVLPDLYSPYSNSENHPWESDDASPSQRILAAVLDLAILSPVFTLLLSGLYQRLKMQVYLGDGGPERFEIWVLWTLSYYFLWVTTSVLFIHFQGSTPGGKLLRLKLVNFKGAKPSLIAIAIRQMVFPLHALFLGSTLFEIYFHEKHLAFHEKVSETRWQSQFSNIHFPVGAFEKRMVGGFARGALFFCALIFAMTLIAKYEGVRNLTFSRNQLLHDEPSCAKSTSKVESKEMSDLIFLNQTKLLSDACLKAEVDLALYSSLENFEGKAWAYFALVQLSQDDEEKEAYEQLICEKTSQACRLLEYRRSQATTELEGFKDSLLFQYYQIVHSAQKKHFAEALRYYENLHQKMGEEVEALRMPILVAWADQQVHEGKKPLRAPSSIKLPKIESQSNRSEETNDYIFQQWNQFKQDLSL